MDKTFIKAFREIVRKEIIKKNTVEISGFGRFEVIHQKQHQKKKENGQLVMMPPRDFVVFSPEDSGDQ